MGDLDQQENPASASARVAPTIRRRASVKPADPGARAAVLREESEALTDLEAAVHQVAAEQPLAPVIPLRSDDAVVADLVHLSLWGWFGLAALFRWQPRATAVYKVSSILSRAAVKRLSALRLSGWLELAGALATAAFEELGPDLIAALEQRARPPALQEAPK
jgi:hypothetical protein